MKKAKPIQFNKRPIVTIKIMNMDDALILQQSLLLYREQRPTLSDNINKLLKMISGKMASYISFSD